jgi:hypothetical protein
MLIGFSAIKWIGLFCRFGQGTPMVFYTLLYGVGAAIWLNFNMALLAKASSERSKTSRHRKSVACSQGQSAAKMESQFISRKSSTPAEKKSQRTPQSTRHSPARVLPLALLQDEEQRVVSSTIEASEIASEAVSSITRECWAA